MRRILTTIVCCCLATVLLHAQSVMVTFTGRDTQNQYVPLSRVEARNLTKGWQETLIWPDTVLVMTATGIENVETCHGASLRLFQNNPNPFNGTTLVTLQVAEPGEVEVVVTDITGRIVGTYRVGANDYSPLHHSPLQPGIYEIRVTLASAGLYFLTVRQNGRTATVKMVNRGNGGNDAITVSPYVELLFIHISWPCERYDFKVLVEPVKPLLHGNVPWSAVCFFIAAPPAKPCDNPSSPR